LLAWYFFFKDHFSKNFLSGDQYTSTFAKIFKN